MIGYIILAIVVIFIVVLLARTLAFKPKDEGTKIFEEITFDKDAAINSLAELIKCKTVSDYDPAKEDNAEFEKLIAKLPNLYPNVFKVCTMEKLPDRALLFRWPGKNNPSGNPAVLMAHYDVVPVEEENWTKPAFDAIIENGVMWGRGTLDTKVTFNGILSAAENLIKQGFTPNDDIYFAFSGGEEVNGPGAIRNVEWFKEHGLTPSMVVDEGGAVVEDIFPGVTGPCGLIGIAEKGMMNLKFDLSSAGGHASSPAPHTPIGRLSAACVKLENHPFPKHFTKPVLAMFDTLGRHSTFVYRMIFANLWCFGGILDMICKKSGGELNALVRTTVAYTMMDGSKAPNVIPPKASMVANLRLNPEDSIKSAIEYVRSVIGDEDIKLDCYSSMEPSIISDINCEGWKRVVNAVEGTWKGSIVSPYLMVQCSDSRHWGEISDKVYRFSAMDLTADERHTIHGNDERIRLETIGRAVEFFIRIMKQC